MANGDDQPKLVPETDLLAVKAKAEKDVGELQSQLDTAKSQSDTHYTNLLSTQAERDKVTAELEELKKEVEQLRPLSADKEGLTKQIKEMEKTLLDVSVKRIAQVYKVPEDKLQGKTLTELNAIEEAFKLTGREAGRFDIAGTPAGAGEGLSAREKVKQGLEQLSKR